MDVIHSAIAENRQIRFHYFDWNVRKEMQLRKDGRFYQVSPWLLTWDDENYYLVAYDADAGKMKHYRVDKMLDLSAVNQARCGRPITNRWISPLIPAKISACLPGKRQPYSFCAILP